ncbi:MAG: S8 family serine peptidase [Faecousia sp.]|nr:S8 family serine peptidase [Bacillota bacterium]
MKQFKSVLAMLLVLVMVISCVGTAFAAKSDTAVDNTAKTPISELGGKNEPTAKSLKGFKSPKFVSKNAYQYGEDETVRAIIVLEGAPEADVATRGSTKAAEQRAKLHSEHKAVKAAMSGINYKLAYEYTALLNGFSCDVAYGDLEKIAAIDGVAAVYIANHYDTPVLETADQKVMISGYFTGNYEAVESGYDGSGMVIAVLDTGLLTTHEAFQDVLGFCAETGTLTEDDIGMAVAPGKYINAKVPFAYDYADQDADVTDHNGHGTHVAGIAAGLAADKEEGAITFMGASPAAQILAMKIFHDDEPGTSSDIYFYALEDAYRLGVDVVNMSIGSQNGFTYDAELETEVFGNIYKRMEKAGIILSVAAGNEYSMAEYSSLGYIGPEYPDYGTVGSPATYEGNVSVGSVENVAYPSYVIAIGEETFGYTDSSIGDVTPKGLWLDTFSGKETEFVVVPDGEGGIALGAPEDFEAVDVTGKIAVVQRGELSFQEKVDNAAAAGAIGCIVVNNQSGSISMMLDPFAIPAIAVPQSAAESFLNAETTTITSSAEREYIMNENKFLMSDFSNWGTSPTLTLDPAISSFGGMIYSSVNTGDSDYDVYSGTSMAAPNMAGTFSNVMTFLEEEGYVYDSVNDEWNSLGKQQRAERAKALLESSATILTDEYDYPYSPRKQGAGLASASEAIDTYYASGFIIDPLKELGDDPEKTGVYSFDVTLVNEGYYDAHYGDFETYVMIDYIADISAKPEVYSILANTLTSEFLYAVDEGFATVTYTIDGEEVTGFDLAEGESVTVNVTITLDEDAKAYLDETFENGTYIEGYVVFHNLDTEEGTVYYSNHATFLGFYGDWTQAPVLEETDFRDFLEMDYLASTTPADEEGNTYADCGYSGFDFLDYYTSPNMGYSFDTTEYSTLYCLGGNIFDYEPFYEEHMTITTPESDGTYYWTDSFALQPYQLRNARHLIMTVTDAETGEVYYVDDTEYLPKAAFDTDANDWTAFGIFVWDGTNADGEYLPTGTVAHVQFDAVLPYSNDPEADGTFVEDVWSFDVMVDSTAPVIEDVVFDAETETLTVTASDAQYLQGIYLTDIYYSDIYDAASFSSDKAGESFTATFDVSGLIEDGFEEIIVTAIDYATNENEVATYLFETDKDATVTLVTPAGETDYAVKTGEFFTFPGCDEEYEGYDFLLWTRTEADKITEEEIRGVDGMYFEDDELLVKGDETFYALYAVGEEVQLEKTNYYAAQEKDYSGDWAIVGLDYVDDSFDTSNPYALGKDCEKVDVAALDDAEIGDWDVEFYTNAEGFRFTFEKVNGKNYTIKNVATGKYLALVDGEIAMVDEVSEMAMWRVSADQNSSLASTVFNAAEPDMLLTYDDEASEFAIYDNSRPYFSFFGLNIYPRDIFSLWLYKCADSEFEAEYYTTTMKAPEPPAPVAPECRFDDFSDCNDVWYHEAVDYAVSEGLMSGIGGGKFDPNGTMTRAMMVTVLYRMAGSPAVTGPSSFTDVPEGQWYSDAIAWAQDNGIVLGVLANKFDPNGYVTREQIATILWRYENKPQTTADLSAFKDSAKISEYAVDAMTWAVSEGIFKGDAGNLKPTAFATRAEFACIVMRYLGGSYACEAIQ